MFNVILTNIQINLRCITHTPNFMYIYDFTSIENREWHKVY